MGGVAYWLRSWNSRRIMGLAAVAVLAVGALGFVLLATLGAFRADTGWSRLRARTRAEDVIVDATTIAAARSLSGEFRDVDGVERTATIAYSYLVPKGRVEDFYGGVILAFGRGSLEQFWRPVVLAGRLPDPRRADEVVVNRTHLKASGRAVGDDVVLVDPFGLIQQKVTIVGVGVMPVDFTFGSGSPLAFTTPAFTARWESELNELEKRGGQDVLGAATLVRSERGVDPDQLAARLVHAAHPGEVGGVTAASTSAELVVDTLELQRTGYTVLAFAAALASLAVLGLAFARACRLRPEETTALRSLGFSRSNRRMVVLVPALVVALAGTLGATILALALERVVPTGLADLVAANSSLGDDWPVIALAALASILALAGLAVFIAARSTTPARPPSRSRNTRLHLIRWPAAAVGLRAASGGRSRQGRRQALVALSAVALSALGITAATVVQSSRSKLYADPSLAGHFFDVNVGTYTDAALARQDRDRLLASDSITALATIEIVFGNVGGVGVEGIVVNSQRGTRAPPMLTGRVPVAADEIAVSRSYSRRGLQVGQSIELGGPKTTRAFRITGTAVLPFAGTSALGEQFLLTPEGRDALGVEPHGYTLVMDVTDPDALRAIHAPNDELDVCTTARLLPLLGVESLPGAREQGIAPCFTRLDQRAANLRELGAIPAAIIVFFAVLGIAGLAFLLGISHRQTRQDLAILRALGFTRRQAHIAVLVQGTTIAAVGALLAIPCGIVVGRWAWRLTVDNIGLVDRPVASILAIGALAIAAAVVGLAVSALSAARTTIRSAGSQLRVD